VGHVDVVFGFHIPTGDAHRVLYFWHSVGGDVLILLSNAATDSNLTDTENFFKIFLRETLDSSTIEESRFSFELEVTAKVAAGRWRIYEVGIRSQERTYEGGGRRSAGAMGFRH